MTVTTEAEGNKTVESTGNTQKHGQSAENSITWLLTISKSLLIWWNDTKVQEKKATIKNQNVILSSNMDESFSVNPGSCFELHGDPETIFKSVL